MADRATEPGGDRGVEVFGVHPGVSGGRERGCRRGVLNEDEAKKVAAPAETAERPPRLEGRGEFRERLSPTSATLRADDQ